MNFHETVTVQSATESEDEMGGRTLTWADTITDLPATIIPGGGATEKPGESETIDLSLFQVIVAGDHPEITSSMRLVASGGRVLEITGAGRIPGRDTILMARVVEPEGDA